MIRRLLVSLAFAAAAGFVLKKTLPDLNRYLKIREM